MKRLVFVALMVTASIASADWIKDVTVEDVRWYGSSNHGFVTISNNSNPGCPDAAASAHLYFDATALGYEKMLSLGLAAMMADKMVDVVIAACDDSERYSVLSGIVVKK